jgi:hypothetical protein
VGHAVLTLAALLAAPGFAAGQSEAPVARSRPESVTVTPGALYAAGGLHRFFFGDHYRDLWTTPIRVQVLDLQRFAGGLTPVKRGGGEQTKSLRFDGGDGRAGERLRLGRGCKRKSQHLEVAAHQENLHGSVSRRRG